MERILLSTTNQRSVLFKATQILKQGGIVIFPTETMYGVGVDATNSEAVSRLLRYKNRPAGKPISVLVANQALAERIVVINEMARNLYATFLPGPVTVISLEKGIVDPRLVSELRTLGVRLSSHPFAAAMAEQAGVPITATSANSSGKARPYSIETLFAGLSEKQKEQIDLIIDAGELPHREPSTVIDTTKEIQEVVRSGEHITQLMPDKTSKSEAETIKIAAEIMASFQHVVPEKPVVFALEGEMGAGKTRFAKGVAKQLGILTPVSSPTYTIMKEYETEKIRLVHMDLWRLGEVTAEEFGLDSYLKPGTVLVIEWAAPLLPYLQSRLEAIVGYHIFIDSQGENERIIRIGAL